MAINAKIDLKKPVLEEISAQVEGAQCVLLVNYSGLTVAQDTQLRKELREAGVHYKVYKNTMMKRARRTGSERDDPELDVGISHG